MMFRRIIAGAFIAICATAIYAQNSVLSVASAGFLSRGIQMYESGNYGGAIDQLRFSQGMTLSDEDRELTDYYIAKSYFHRGDANRALYLLSRFLTDYPTSFKIPEVYSIIGDIYFYEGYFGQAVTAYDKVNRKALAMSHNEDVTYRYAYSLLRVKAGSVVKGQPLDDNGVEDCREQSIGLFESLSKTKRYGDAVIFYNAYSDYEKGDYDSALNGFSSVNPVSDLGYHAQYYMCQIYYLKNDMEKTLDLGLALLGDENDSEMNTEIYRIVGETYYRNSEDENALKYINQYFASCKTETMITAQYILGVLNYRNADYQKSIDLLGCVAKEESVLGQSAYYYIGQSYRKQDKKQLATMAFEKAAKQTYSKPTQEVAFYNYAVMQNEGGRTPFSNTIDMFEDFLMTFPQSKYADDVREYMMILYITGNDYEKALSSISRIKSPSSKVLATKQVVLYNLGINALSNGKVEEARKYFMQSRQLSNYDTALDAQNSLWLGECAYRAGNFEQAAKYQNEYLKSVSSTDKNYGLGYYNLGYSRFNQKKYEEARNAFTKALSSRQLTTQMTNDANSRIGDTYYYTKNFKTAQKYYEKTSGDYAVYQKGIMLGLEKDYSGKVKQMNLLKKKYPSSSLVPMAMLEEADAYMSMNNSKKAIVVYEDVVKKFPSSAYARKALLNKAITERDMKKEKEAVTTYKEVLRKYPTSEEAGIALEDMKLIYAEKGELDKLAEFMATIRNAPKLDVNDMDKLTFETAERAYVADNNNISKMESYLKNNPNGAYMANAKYYVAKYHYNKGNNTKAMEMIDDVERTAVDAPFIEDMLAMKASILVEQEDYKDALNTYKKMEEKASNADNRLVARLGTMRIAMKVGSHKEVIEKADALLQTGDLTPEEENETIFSRAMAYYQQGKDDVAAKDFMALAGDVRNVYGTQSAYYLAEIKYKKGELKESENLLNTFIEAGIPHQYWLARGFILLADIYHEQGKNFEACEYLESLKNNYPGDEEDIYDMIDERLGKWKTETKKD